MPPGARASDYADPLSWGPAGRAAILASRAWNRASTLRARSSAWVICARKAYLSPENSAFQVDWRLPKAWRATSTWSVSERIST
eukprot:13943812-Alexandrium_andersonii.AAC.1